MILRLLRSILALPIMPVPPGMRPSTPSDFSLLALAQNTNVYSEGVTTITTSGTNVTLTPAQVLAKNIVLEAGASGPFTITLPATSAWIDALGPTMPLDGSFFFELSIWNNGTAQTGTLTPFDANTTINPGDTLLPTDTTCKWMVQVAQVTVAGLGRPTNLTITKTSTAVAVGSAGSGTVTSVALAAPVEFTVSGSPVSTTGTLTLGKATETANTVWAGPTSGGAAQPTFRALVSADLPGGGGGVTSVGLAMPVEFVVSGTPVTGTGTLTATKAAENANTVWAGPTSGSPAQPTFRAITTADLPLINGWVFGQGNDGAIVFDGVATFSFATLASNVYTLNRNIFATNITVNVGVSVAAVNLQIFATGTITCNGTIHCNGGASGGVNPAFRGIGCGSATSGVYGFGENGGDGGNGGPGTGNPGSSVTNAAGSAAGAGGAGVSAAGGAGGTSTAITGDRGGIYIQYHLFFQLYGHVIAGSTNNQIFGGAGGGGGGMKFSVENGTGGGGGGGVLGIFARFIAGNGAFQARGGGSASTSAGGGTGGGGGGGFVAVVTTTSNWQSLITADANGGVAGTATGGGTAGTNGTNGFVSSIILV